MKLRDYQQRAIDDLYAWMRANKGNPCLVLPTGSGKSHIIGKICEDAIKGWPGTRVLMLTSAKELIAQNAEKLLTAWPNAPLGIYSAGMRSRDIDAITFAGIQSIHSKAKALGRVDIVLVDECHLISHRAQGMYRKLIDELEAINPAVRVVGLTATPYRLGHGYITDGDAIFDALLDPVTIPELVSGGYLATLRSRQTDASLDTTGVAKRGGDYVESQLQRAVDKEDDNRRIVREVIDRAEGRRSWLFFCAGVDHALHIRDELISQGIAAKTVTGKTPKKERDEILAAFKRGEITALTNANVLTTGFDAPNIDLIAMLRPTESPGLYVQMAGRGLRLKEHTDHCLVLDFAGVVRRHGPITYVAPPTGSDSDGDGEAPVKVCDNCGELCHPSAKLCPSCSEPFPEPEKKSFKLHDDDIMGMDASSREVSSWRWYSHTSKSSGKQMIVVAYQGALSDKPVREYLTIYHDGWAGQKAWSTLYSIMEQSGARMGTDEKETIDNLNAAQPPSQIMVRPDGKFTRVIRRIW